MATGDTVKAPSTDVDFYSDEVATNPYPVYRALRDTAAAVWLEKNEAWAITRYADVREALRDTEVFSSAHGCMLNRTMNEATRGIMLCSDDPGHRAMRTHFARPLSPKAVGELKARVAAQAERKVEELVARGRFDAVADLAHYLPMTLVTELVGLDEEGRARMLEWAAGIFNAFGPEGNARTAAGIATALDVLDYIANRLSRDRLVPDGWGARILGLADTGELPAEQARAMLLDYLTPALDTTINATSSAVWLFARHPDQWDLVRADPTLIPHAINEVVRLESPIRAFARYVTRDHALDGVRLDAGSRALVVYASANRDERKWADPERFDVTRKPGDHLGFGYGTHTCAGMHLAKLEITCILQSLAPRVARFELVDGDGERVPHNVLRGLRRLEVAVY